MHAPVPGIDSAFLTNTNHVMTARTRTTSTNRCPHWGSPISGTRNRKRANTMRMMGQNSGACDIWEKIR